MVELAKVVKSGSLRLDNEEDFEDWTNCLGLEQDDLPFEDGSGLKRRKMDVVGLPKPRKLGIFQRDMKKASPNCNNSRKQGRIPNQEKLKWDSESSGYKNINEMLKVGKNNSLPK